MSTISAGNTVSTAITITGDTTGNVVITATGGFINAAGATGGFIVPTGNTAQRSANAVAGTIRFNTTSNTTEIYSGTAWITVTSQTYTVDYLIVAGGGGGGTGSGGGGGAGGVVSGSTT